MTTQELFGRRERLAFVAGALILAAVVLISAWLALRTSGSLSEAAHSQEVRAATVDLLQEVTSAETGQRGYLLTGKPEYLAPYEHAVRRVPQLLRQVAGDLDGNPDFRALRAGVQAKLAELAHTVAMFEAGEREAALGIVQSDLGERLMLELGEHAARLTEAERQVLNNRIGSSRTGAEALVVIDVIAFALIVALAAVIVNGIRRTVNELRAAQETVEAANAELGRGRERLEIAVRRRTAQLTRANEEIQRFAYIVSHDLRAPLLNIIGFTSELENATTQLKNFVETNVAQAEIGIPVPVREAYEQDLPEAIRFIQSSTTKMDRLINAILRLSREGRRVLVPEPLDMAALLRNIVDSLRHQAEEAGAELELGEAPPITSDRIAVEQIFSNLAENALKYLKPGRAGHVRIHGRRDGKFVRYAVRDNGRGIAERDRERIFELFRRAGVQDVAGEGIGLAHVRALSRRLGGEIGCESELDVGSEFTLRLPAVLEHTEES